MSTRKSISAVYHACWVFVGEERIRKLERYFPVFFFVFTFLRFFCLFIQFFYSFSLQKSEPLTFTLERKVIDVCTWISFPWGSFTCKIGAHVALFRTMSLHSYAVSMHRTLSLIQLCFSFSAVINVASKIPPLSSRNNRTAEISVLNWTNFICVFVVLFVVSLPLCRIRFWVFPHRITQNSFQLSCRARRRQRSILFKIFSIAFFVNEWKIMCVLYTQSAAYSEWGDSLLCVERRRRRVGTLMNKTKENPSSGWRCFVLRLMMRAEDSSKGKHE